MMRLAMSLRLSATMTLRFSYAAEYVEEDEANRQGYELKHRHGEVLYAFFIDPLRVEGKDVMVRIVKVSFLAVTVSCCAS